MPSEGTLSRRTKADRKPTGTRTGPPGAPFWEMIAAVDRRTFVKGALGASGAVLLGAAGGAAAGAAAGAAGQPGPPSAPEPPRPRSPPPAKSGIEHVIVVMMENRSFDHFLGWLPHADGKQAGLSYADPQGTPQSTFHQTQFNGCGFTDPDHSYAGGRLQYNDGKMDGFLSDTANDTFAISYYTAKDRPFMSRLAQAYTTCDRYFCSILGPTYPNRFFQHAAQTDRLDDALTKSHPPHHLGPAQPPGRPDGSLLLQRRAVRRPLGRHLLVHLVPVLRHSSRDAAAGTLPNVSYLDPKFAGEADRDLGRRSPTGRHPRRRRLLVAGLPRRGLGTGLGQDRARHQLRRMGRLLRPRRAAPHHRGRARRHRPDVRRGHRPQQQGQGALRVPGAVHRGLTLQPHRGHTGRRSPTTSTTTPRCSS